MIRLNLSSEPRWVELAPSVRVKVAPLTTALVMAARRDPAFVEAAQAGTAGTEEALSKALARVAVLEWEGVADMAGNPLPVTPEAVTALLDLWPIYQAWSEKVLTALFVLDAEKNASAASPTGSSEGAANTAKPAKGSARTAPRG